MPGLSSRYKSSPKNVLRHGTLLGLVLLLLIGAGCNTPPATEPPDSGNLAAGVYTNTFFRFKITLPAHWFALTKKGLAAKGAWSEEVFRSQQQAGMPSPSAPNSPPAEQNSYNLFMVSQLQPDTTGTFNPSLSCVAERVSQLPQPVSPVAFLAKVKTLLAGSKSFTASFAGEPDTVTLGRRKFARLRANLAVGPVNITQEYYALAADGYILALVKSYQTNEQGALMEQSLQSLHFLADE